MKSVLPPPKLESLSDWLTYYKLEKYIEVFNLHGFDHIDYIGEDIIDEQDMDTLGVVDEKHRNMLKEALHAKGFIKGMYIYHIIIILSQFLFFLMIPRGVTYFGNIIHTYSNYRLNSVRFRSVHLWKAVCRILASISTTQFFVLGDIRDQFIYRNGTNLCHLG